MACPAILTQYVAQQQSAALQSAADQLGKSGFRPDFNWVGNLEANAGICRHAFQAGPPRHLRVLGADSPLRSGESRPLSEGKGPSTGLGEPLRRRGAGSAGGRSRSHDADGTNRARRQTAEGRGQGMQTAPGRPAADSAGAGRKHGRLSRGAVSLPGKLATAAATVWEGEAAVSRGHRTGWVAEGLAGSGCRRDHRVPVHGRGGLYRRAGHLDRPRHAALSRSTLAPW